MYRSQLSREVKLIVQGQQEWLRDFTVFWAQLVVWLSIGSTKVLAVVSRFR